MARFWLATFQGESEAPGPAGAWALEVIHEDVDGFDEYAVLLSKADEVNPPTKLECRLGFANGSKTCSIWQGRGFPLLDAVIDKQADGTLRVCCPAFLRPAEVNYDAHVISIPNFTLTGSSSSTSAKETPLNVSYNQEQQAPDYAFPATFLRRKSVAWSPKRSGVLPGTPTELDLKVEITRWPSLAPWKAGTMTPQAVWHGDLEVPQWPPGPKVLPGPLLRVNRVDQFGPPQFRFEGMEVLGFRLNLDDLGVSGSAGQLAAMIERLNYHLLPPDQTARRSEAPIVRSPIPDFRYRPASRTLIIEMLRYDKMKLQGPLPPLNSDDYQSQHELLVRLLVGRVDDDSAQARDPATFVPTIFVDNSWSKTVGREVQGFDKWLADFCIEDEGRLVPLWPDGRRRDKARDNDNKPQALASVRQVSLVTGMGRQQPSDRHLVKLDCPYETIKDWDSLEPVDLDFAMGVSALAPTRWRQDDFDEAEFRRSFARSAIPGSLKGFRSIQVSPIGERELLDSWRDETALIRGTFTIQGRPEFATPNGTISLTLCANAHAPQAWRDVCRMLGIAQGKEDTITLTTGNWYRMRCSMGLTIQNSFD